MTTFYLCRHGETESNVAHRLQGWIDTPLTEKGLVPTHKVIATLGGVKFDAIYSSDLGRAFVTAYVIGRGLQFPGEIVRLSGLREVNYGEAANMKAADAYEKYPRLDRDTHFTPPGGESLAHMQARVLRTLEDIARQHADQTVLLVAHSGVMAALRANHLDTDFGEHNISEAYPHDFVAKLKVAGGKVTSFLGI